MSDQVRAVACGTATELLDVLSPRSSLFRSSLTLRDWAFRGHGNSAYQLVPSALRPDRTEHLAKLAEVPKQFRGSLSSVAGQAFAEARLLLSFFSFADESGLSIPGDSPGFRKRLSHEILEIQNCITRQGSSHVIPWPDEELLPLMALAQHHRLPTRLLDWTYSSFVAAYFAAESAVRRPAGLSATLSVWAFDRIVLGACRFPQNPYDSELLVRFVTAPRASNPNLHAQSGVFTLEFVPDVRPDVDIERRALDQLDYRLPDRSPLLKDRPLFLHFTLPVSEAPELQWLLAREGYTAARCFPGFDGVARFLEEAARCPRPA